jgi:hypothetical protein
MSIENYERLQSCLFSKIEAMLNYEKLEQVHFLLEKQSMFFPQNLYE